MEIIVLGSCCGHGENIREMVEKVLVEHALKDKVTLRIASDTVEIMCYGILATPGLVVNGKLKFNGRVPREWEIKSFILEEF